MQLNVIAPPIHTDYAELEEMLSAESNDHIVLTQAPADPGTEEDAYDTQILAGLVTP